ncbi:alpha/beta hydrolase, partial [Streptomyces sp. SID10244]|nr:alpha/beta hydrolase [Streptomyces sp. SID10244]
MLFAAAAMAAVMGAAGCAIGPDLGPDAVTGGGGGDAAPSSSKAAPALPALGAPKTDLGWKDCARPSAARFGVPAPGGVTVECAELDVPVNPDNPTGDTLTVALTR